MREPGLDVLSGRAAGVARRQQIQIDGSPGPDRACARSAVKQVGQPGDVVAPVAHGRFEEGSLIALRLGRDANLTCVIRRGLEQ